jgi:hypothetical protein
VGHVACMVVVRCVYKILVRKPEGKKPLGRHRHNWEDNVRMNLGKIGWEGRIGCTWHRVMNLQVS